jgi:acyl carrier protein
VFVRLEALPLTLNGKLDEKQLPYVAESQSDLNRPYIAADLAPRSEIKELIAQIWIDVLKLHDFTDKDNFFEVGGDSLLALQVVSQLRKTFKKSLPIRILFDAPSITTLADEIEKSLRQTELPELLPTVSATPGGVLPLSINQEHLWYLVNMLPASPCFNMPYVYYVRAELNFEALQEALREIVQRHDALRAVFSDEAPPSQSTEPSREIELAITDLRELPQVRVQRRAAMITVEESSKPFNLSKGPLIRTRLLRLTSQDYLLLVTMHHIVSDRWSMQVFRYELLMLYKEMTHSGKSTLPKPSASFIDFVVSEREALLTGRMTPQLNYWIKKLATPVPPLIFLKRLKATTRSEFDMLCRPIQFRAEEYNNLKAIALREHCTRFMVLLAGLYVTLHSLTGNSKIRIGTHVSNRLRTEFQHCIGHFVNTVILEASILPHTTLRQFLAEVRQDCILAQVNQEVPFETIVSRLENDQKISRQSLCQVFLNYQSYVNQQPVISDFSLTPLDLTYRQIHSRTILTTFDLIFNLKESSSTLGGQLEQKKSYGRKLGSRTIKILAQILDAFVSHPQHEIAAILELLNRSGRRDFCTFGSS